MIRAENDNDGVNSGGGNAPLFRPRPSSLFLPTAVIAAGYAVAFVALHWFGKGDSALARLCIMVLVLGVPLLLASATLRYFMVHVRLLTDTIIVHPGLPVREAREIAYSHIRNLHVSQGMSGKLSDSGTLILELVTGERVSVDGLAEPQKIMSAMQHRLDDGIEPDERDRIAAAM